MSNKKNKSLYIISKATQQLKLNENESALSSQKRYILEGVFGVVNTDTNRPNRNDRLYDEAEYLPHIKAFRDELQRGIPVLGELDHPMDGPEGPRFEVLLKNASHRILDVWYDKVKKLVMGKLEILDTPNGNIVKSLINAGVPIFVSSRASGFVNPNKHVTIHKIFTWDIVAKPGFEEARVNLINESVSESYTKYLNKFKCDDAPKNVALKYNVLNENTCIYEINAENIVEDDELSVSKEPTIVRPEDPSKLTPHTKVEPQVGRTASKLGSLSKVNSITYEASVSGLEKDKDAGADKDKSLIKNIEYAAESDNDDTATIIDIKPKFVNTLEGEDKEEFEKKKKAKSAKAKEKKAEKKDSKYDDLIDKYSKKKEEEESVKESYAWTSILKPNQFKRFVDLSESEKEAMTTLVLTDNRYFYTVSPLMESESSRTMQESTFRSLYYDALNYSENKKLEEQEWFKFAPDKYKEYFRSLPQSQKDMISKKADFFIFESAAEVEDFWMNVAGTASLKSNYLEEKNDFIFKVPQAILNEMIEEERNSALGYNVEEIEQVGALMESYKPYWDQSL